MDREKVIKGLECCAEAKCEICPYEDQCFGEEICVCSPMAKDAFELFKLLKAQEARVMTLEELENWNGPIYFEEIDTNEYYALIETVELGAGNNGAYVFMNVMPGEHHRRAFDGAYYNIFWRCWTSRPTDEQMDEVKWND